MKKLTSQLLTLFGFIFVLRSTWYMLEGYIDGNTILFFIIGLVMVIIGLMGINYSDAMLKTG